MSDTDLLNQDFATHHPELFAKAAARAEPEDIAAVLDAIAPAAALAVAARLPVNALHGLLVGHAERLTHWINGGGFDDAAALLGRLPRDASLRLMEGLERGTKRRRLLQFLNYPVHTVGGYVSEARMQFDQDLDMAVAVDQLREAPELSRNAVVVDSTGRYAGMLDLLAVATSPALSGRVADFVVPVPALRAELPLGVAAHVDEWQAHAWLVVVDHADRVLGFVTRSRLIERLQQEREGGVVVGTSLLMMFDSMLYVFNNLLTQVLFPRSGR